jgi:NADH-quinone oxidoreductase subunit N
MTSLDLSVIAPLGFVCAGAILALLVDTVLSSRIRPAADAGDESSLRRRVLIEARIGTTLALVCAVSLALAIYTASYVFVSGAHASLDPRVGLIVLDPLSTFSIALIGFAVMLCVLLSIAYLPALHIEHRGYYALLMLSSAGIVLVVTAVDLMVLFVGVELMTVPLYGLAALTSRSATRGEAALKLAITSAFSSAVLLLGAALLYGATGGTSYAVLTDGLRSGNVVALAGVALLLAGVAFKVMAFPFQGWAADVLEGAPTVVTSVMSVATQTAAIVVLLRLVALAIQDGAEPNVFADRLQTLVAIIAGATMIVGSVMALIQTNVKRMLAHAGVAHAGMMLLGIACATEQARAAVLFSLIVYAFTTVGAFGVLIAMSYGGRDCESIESFAGLGIRHPTLAAAMALFLLALAGVPGTGGFVARFQLFASAVVADQIALVLVACFSSVVLLACYLRIPTAMYMRAPSARGPVEPASGELFVLAVCAAAVLYLGFAPDADPFGAGLRTIEAAGRAAVFGP